MSVYDVASAEDVAALRATVERQGEALRRLVGILVDPGLATPSGGGAWLPGSSDDGHDAESILAALDAPAPDTEPLIDGYTAVEWASVGVTDPALPADAPLPGPVAEAVNGLERPGNWTQDQKNRLANALAAWARAQQQPALGDDVREAMREAIDALDDAGKRLRHPFNTDDQLRAGDACYAASDRLRELAGEP